MFEKVSEMVDEGNEDGIGEENGGMEVEVLIRVVLIVEDKISVVEIDMVSTEDIPGASLCFIPSPILSFVSILDMCIGMPEVRTSYETDPVIETSGGMTTTFSGMLIIRDSLKSVVVSVRDTCIVPPRLTVSSKVNLSGEDLCGASQPISMS